MPDTPEKDPVITSSLATLLVISSVLLMLTLVWALYNEFFGLRPWKSYQREFARRYHSFLLKQIPKQKAAEKAILESAEYQQLDQQLKTMEAQVKDQVGGGRQANCHSGRALLRPHRDLHHGARLCGHPGLRDRAHLAERKDLVAKESGQIRSRSL